MCGKIGQVRLKGGGWGHFASIIAKELIITSSKCLFLLTLQPVIRYYKGIEFLPQTKKGLMPIYLQPDGINLQNFKLWIFDLIEFSAWNSNGLKHRVSEILGLENQRLWQKLNSLLLNYQLTPTEQTFFEPFVSE